MLLSVYQTSMLGSCELFYLCTLVLFSSSTCVLMYSCIPVPLCTCTLINIILLYSCNFAFFLHLYSSTCIPLYNCTILKVTN